MVPERNSTEKLARAAVSLHTGGTMLSAGDIVYILFLAICVWLAVYLWDDGDGGGRKAKIPA